jgi:hypothetical protein
VVTAGDLHGSTPTLYLIISSSKAAADAEGASSSDEDDAGGAVEASQAAELSSNTAVQGGSGNTAEAMLVHRKPRGSKGVLLQLKPLTGYDVRHSVQKCAVQCGVRLAVSAQLASHSTDEALKYAANCSYETAASTGTLIKLVSNNKQLCGVACWIGAVSCSVVSHFVEPASLQAVLQRRTSSAQCAVLTTLLYLCLFVQARPEWRKGRPPAELQLGSSIAGVPMDWDLLSYGPSAIAAPKGAMLTAVLRSSCMQRSVTAIDNFVRGWAADETLLNRQLYEPALGDAGTGEQLPVVLLREFASLSSMHLRSSSNSSSSGVGKFLSRLPRISFAGLAAPECSRLVDGRLTGAYAQMALPAQEVSAAGAGVPPLRQEATCKHCGGGRQKRKMRTMVAQMPLTVMRWSVY